MKMSGVTGTGHSHVEEYGSPHRQSISSLGARLLSDTTKEQTLILTQFILFLAKLFLESTKKSHCNLEVRRVWLAENVGHKSPSLLLLIVTRQAVRLC